MAISDLLNRRVRALPVEDEEIYSESASGSDEGPEVIEQADSDSDVSRGFLSETDDSADEADDAPAEYDDDDDDDDDENENSLISDEGSASDSDSSAPSENEDVKASLSGISFGALAKAQASLGPKTKTKRSSKPTDGDESSPLDDIRARIREAREQKRQLSGHSNKTDDSEKKPARSSKHAPMVQSSKRAVTRKRTIIEPPAVPKARDPRFDPTVMSNSVRSNPAAANKAYAFLDEYRASELKDMKEQLRKTKNYDEKEELKRKIRSTTDRMRAIESQKRERDIMEEHRKKEKQLIREGKKSNPYYLKKSDLKKQVLLKKYENMNSKERMKALERRRKKVASKERKEMPMERRGFEGDAPASHGGDRKRRRME